MRNQFSDIPPALSGAEALAEDDLGERSRLDRREPPILIVEEGPRLERALAAAFAAPAPALIVTGSLARLQRIIQDDVSRQARMLVLAPSLDAVEVDRRLLAFEAGGYGVIAVLPERLWQARFGLALEVRPPALVVVDAARFATGDLASRLVTERVIARLAALAPAAAVLLLHGPASLPEPQRVDGAVGISPRLEGPLVPPSLCCRVAALTGSHERLVMLRRALERHRRGLLIAPSRGAVVKLTEALWRLGLHAAPYHLGLLAAERITLLRAFRDRRQDLLVATGAILQEDHLVAPPLLGLTHPPPSLSMLLRLAALAEQSEGPVDLLVCCAEADLAALPGIAAGPVPSLAHLRSLYRTLRRLHLGDTVLLDVDGPRLPPALADLGSPEVVRAMLDLLEAAGYLRREDDLPKAAHVTLAAADSEPPDWLASLGAPRPGVAFPIQPAHLARTLRVSPAALQRRLLGADRAGHLQYRPIGRERLYVLQTAPSESAALLHGAVQAQAARAAAAAGQVAAWLRGGGCRVQDLALAAGFPAPERCGRCDRCTPREGRAPRQRDPLLVALSALAGLALDMPRGAVYRVVRAGLLAAGLAADRRSVALVIDELLADGALTLRQGSLGEVLGISEAGSRLLAGNGTLTTEAQRHRGSTGKEVS